jgi:hypothetical protein
MPGLLSHLFSPKPPLDEASIDWIFQVFGWALSGLGAPVFRDETVLVTPTNEHFPGRAGSVHEMAELIFHRTAEYAGMAHWPLRLMPPGGAFPATAPRVAVEGVLRGSEGLTAAAPNPTAIVPVAYDPALVANPEALIAGFAQTLAHHLGSAVHEIPPGGLQNWAQATEVVAVFMGFGLILANTAFQFQARSCGSCGGPAAQRQAFLSQWDITYALALFCVLEDIPDRAVLRHLKKALRGYYKRCVRDVGGRREQLDALRALA